MIDDQVEPLAERSKGRWQLLLLIILFLAPIVLAWWSVGSYKVDGPAELLNRGTLLDPTIDARALISKVPLSNNTLAVGQWLVLYTAPTCGSECLDRIGKLVDIRGTLGHDGTRTELGFLTASPAPDAVSRAVHTVVDEKARDWLVAALRSQTDFAGAGYVLVDWRGQIPLFYAAQTSPGDIQKDLKRLLRASRIR
ncbi:MAG: hypothetical protein AAF384_00905 [Pseudomonadota bacterium]